MELLRHKQYIKDGYIIREETHAYKDFEKCISYKRMWEKAGFKGCTLYTSKDLFIISYVRFTKLVRDVKEKSNEQ